MIDFKNALWKAEIFPLFFSDFNHAWILLDRFFEKKKKERKKESPNVECHENLSIGSLFVPKQKGRRDTANKIIAGRGYAKAPKM